MLAVVLVVVLGGSVLAGDILGQRLRVPPPLVLLLIGAVLGFVPALREVHLPPEVMLLLILPALLYWDSLTTSVREARANLRGILLLGTALVVVTAAAVASVAHAFGLGWGPAWVLGAALAPTDATAVAALARALPRRLVTTLRVESLINDGTALVVYAAAVAVTVSGTHFGPGSLALRFLLAYAGGAIAGLALHWVIRRLRRHMNDLLHENVLGVLAPFAAFLLAQPAHASGVIAVVVYGLLLSREAPRSVRADTRQRGEAFWSLMTFALNGALFILIGIEGNAAVRSLSSVDLARGLAAALAIYASVIAARFGWLFTTPYLLRAIDRRPQQRARRLGSGPRVVLALANFRGAVSLAAILAVPRTLHSGRPFPGRDLLVFVVATVITLTLAQAVLLPRVVRWAQLPADTSTTTELELAKQTAIKEALTALPDEARALDVADEAATRARQELEAQLNRADRPARGDTPEPRDEYAILRLALISRERAAVVRLRDEEQIDDDVLRVMQGDLDFEELRLSRRRP